MKFLKENWYKLMTGTAMLIFASGFFIYAVSPSYASYNGNSPSKSDYALVPLNKDGSINIKISEEQMTKLMSPTSGTQKVMIMSGYNSEGDWSGAKVLSGNLSVE